MKIDFAFTDWIILEWHALLIFEVIAYIISSFSFYGIIEGGEPRRPTFKYQ